ncbi:MAG TPA: ABC transporter permease [Steroidobacteraceae bacterium]|nr:ABC transporter permease [Steroidobacteraceae bacterium]
MREVGSRKLMWLTGWSVMAFLYAPIIVMAAFSFNDSDFIGLPFRGFTLHWYRAVLQDQQVLRSIWNSVYVAIGAVALSLAFGLPAAIALDRYQFPGKTLFRRIVLLPIVLPGVITGVSLLLFYVQLGFRLSLNTIILGQGTALMCVTITEVFARLNQIGRSREEAALDLGATPFEVFRHVTLPAIRSALIGAMLISFSISFDEIAVTYLLTGRQNTLPMTLWSMLRRSVTPEVNAISALIVAASIILITAGMRFARRDTTHGAR